MPFTLHYLIACFFHDAVNNAVALVKAAAPESGEVFFQRFWFADAFVAISFNILDKLIDTFQRLFILCLPIEVLDSLMVLDAVDGQKVLSDKGIETAVSALHTAMERWEGDASGASAY